MRLINQFGDELAIGDTVVHSATDHVGKIKAVSGRLPKTPRARSGSCGPEIPILRKFRLLILALHLSKCCAYQQAGERAPGEFGAIFGRQMLFDQRSHISERFQGQHIGQRGESSQPGFDSRASRRCHTPPAQLPV